MHTLHTSNTLITVCVKHSINSRFIVCSETVLFKTKLLPGLKNNPNLRYSNVTIQ